MSPFDSVPLISHLLLLASGRSIEPKPLRMETTNEEPATIQARPGTPIKSAVAFGPQQTISR